MNAPLAWSPQIDIRSVVVSESRNKELIEVKMDFQSEVNKWNWYDQYINYLVQSFSAKMTFSLTTTVKCSMNFEMFPFDSHICKLEVSPLSIYVYLFLLQNKSYSNFNYFKV